MILKGKSNNSEYSFLWLALLVILLIPFLVLRFSQIKKPSQRSVTNVLEIKCGAENVEGDSFVNGDYKFLGGHTRSNELVRSGEYASKLDSANKFGITYIMENPVGGKRYKVEAWSQNKTPIDGYLAVSAENPEDFYKEVIETTKVEPDYWEKRELYFTVPQNKTPQKLKIYAYKANGPNTIFFDDFKITEVDPLEKESNGPFEALDFKLVIDKKGVEKLKENKNKSIMQGLVFHDGSKVKAKIWDDGKYKKVKIRHKGDWLDHMGNNPSYRVDMNSNESWNGMQSFSVQSPHTRGFLREWVFFQFLDYADVLRPRYDFIWFQENNNERVVFSYEEHFTKNLVENKNRREGPILKLTEDQMWEVTKRTMALWRNLPIPNERDKAFWNSEIRAFKEAKFKNNAKLKSDFEVAQNLMYQFKYGLKPVDQIFDVDRLAKYLALVDICMAHHAVTWHNQRFYYNPVTALLEPIGFDAFSELDPKKYAWKIYSEDIYNNGSGQVEPIDLFLYDDVFVEKYFYYLNEYSKPQFVDSFLDDIEPGILTREKFVKRKYNRKNTKDKARQIQVSLPAHVNSLQVFTKKLSKAEEGTEGFRELQIINEHSFPLEILTGEPISIKGKIIYPRAKSEVPQYVDWKIQENVKQIEYKVVGIDSIYAAPVLDWGIKKNESPRQALTYTDLNKPSEYFDVEGNAIVFKEGLLEIDSLLVLPPDMRVIINSGTNIRLTNKAFILSYSPVFLRGDPDEPIIISSNGDGGSFTVIQANDKSLMRHVVFENQNTLNYKSWQLTGAVNFYESDVEIINTLFKDNQCEDALNIIRSNFELTRSVFENIYGDAFDSDFCKGAINLTNFTNIGNDAIDASGSVITIESCKINKAGDKGVSAGERSNLDVSWTTINGAVIGLASKDHSVLTLDEIKLKNCQTGFTAYQKKPEFGPAKIILKKYRAEEVGKLFLIEEKSVLKEN